MSFTCLYNIIYTLTLIDNSCQIDIQIEAVVPQNKYILNTPRGVTCVGSFTLV